MAGRTYFVPVEAVDAAPMSDAPGAGRAELHEQPRDADM